ncbi:MAG: hypothetical protein OEY44_02890 [Candidatus Peregrinibacteria bacterium]|nr:hypothetical protein [Candidatus Peregrinibacteria bacterium]
MSCLNTLRLNLPILQGGDAALRHLQGDDLFEVTLGQGIHAAAFTGDELTEEDSHRTLELAPSTWPPEIK